ncbi:hypothetical protein ACJX0J_015560 [Zea mays]
MTYHVFLFFKALIIYLAVSVTGTFLVNKEHYQLRKSSILCDLEVASMGPNGVIHLVAALGYDWAIRPIIINTAAGTSNLPAMWLGYLLLGDTSDPFLPILLTNEYPPQPLVLMPCRELVQVQLPSIILKLIFSFQTTISFPFLIPIFGDMEMFISCATSIFAYVTIVIQHYDFDEEYEFTDPARIESLLPSIILNSKEEEE